MRNRLLLAALAGLLALIPAIPAYAVPLQWVRAPCATGSVTTYAGSFDAQGRRRVHLEGWVQPCAEPPANASFTVVYYYTIAAQPQLVPTPDDWIGLLAYGPADTPTPFTHDVFVDPIGNVDPQQWFGPLQAVCVVRDYEAPIACVAIELPADGSVPQVTPVPVDDWRITSVPVHRAVDPDGGDEPDPHCGTCV